MKSVFIFSSVLLLALATHAQSYSVGDSTIECKDAKLGQHIFTIKKTGFLSRGGTPVFYTDVEWPDGTSEAVSETTKSKTASFGCMTETTDETHYIDADDPMELTIVIVSKLTAGHYRCSPGGLPPVQTAWFVQFGHSPVPLICGDSAL